MLPTATDGLMSTEMTTLWPRLDDHRAHGERTADGRQRWRTVAKRRRTLPFCYHFYFERRVVRETSKSESQCRIVTSSRIATAAMRQSMSFLGVSPLRRQIL